MLWNIAGLILDIITEGIVCNMSSLLSSPNCVIYHQLNIFLNPEAYPSKYIFPPQTVELHTPGRYTRPRQHQYRIHY